ncbi:MAG: hypothetical protein R3E97_16655 [Candidatus Eisenbacteria bacterium]
MDDPELTDFENYPADMWMAPGSQAPNRQALGTWGAWCNAWGKKKYGSTALPRASQLPRGPRRLDEHLRIRGFSDTEGWGW